MTFGELLFWIIVAIIAYFIFKVGLAILIIVIVIIVLYYIFNSFNNTNNAAQAYDTYYEGYESAFPVSYSNPYFGNPQTIQYAIIQLPEQQELGNDTRHGDYWYMPVQDYYDEKQNSYIVPKSCEVPQSISEYCVNKQMQQTGNMDLAISRCNVPTKTSVNCAC
ncbi:ferrichrome outer membrane transporter [Tupanvirus soda lake]|uniref:Ferrichrome outer membrane transporter n=2 Tax=Tupanvirus TaxID=2094720 RepID=A0A6N1NSQ1_9VIRU|nr:ferrichrome outer membrane transporter [Tupanvirus soda lake]QKU34708.1 ferrichrome outer membrane transporter [Tupanvirus soda lake]